MRPGNRSPIFGATRLGGGGSRVMPGAYETRGRTVLVREHSGPARKFVFVNKSACVGRGTADVSPAPRRPTHATWSTCATQLTYFGSRAGARSLYGISPAGEKLAFDV